MLKEETEKRTCRLLPDPHARHHIFAADGEGAQALFDLLDCHRAELKGRITVVYADTGPAGAHFTLRLCQLDIDRVCVLPSLLGAVALLSVMIERAVVGVRIYAAGSETLVNLIVQLAVARGLDPMSVMADRWSARVAVD